MKPQFYGENGPEGNCASPDTDGRRQELRVGEQAGQRLDHTLEALLPHMGVRGRKRCIESGLVLVNGRSAAASRRMREGDVICLLDAAETTPMASAQAAPGAAIAPAAETATASPVQVAPRATPMMAVQAAPGAVPTPAPTSERDTAPAAATGSAPVQATQTVAAAVPEHTPTLLAAVPQHAPALLVAAPHSDPCALAASLGLRMLDRQGEYCFFSKPANMHSAALAGSTQASVEALAPTLAAAWDGSFLCRTTGQTYDPVMPCARRGCGQTEQGAAQDQATRVAAQRMAQGQKFMLLQRLDFGTSGLLCAALTPAAAAAFRAAEAEGHCEKRYVALLTGVLTGPITARQSLGVSGRRKSRLRDAQADKTRWTDFWPLHVWHPDAMDAEELRLLFGVAPDAAGLTSGMAGGTAKGAAKGTAVESGHFLPEESSPVSAPWASGPRFSLPPQGLTLAACRIRRGARHQIRVHAAGLGHALWGDALYADQEGALSHDSGSAEPSPDLPGFFLHHGGLRLPGIACVDYPPWPLPEALSRLVRAWFAGVLPQAEQKALNNTECSNSF